MLGTFTAVQVQSFKYIFLGRGGILSILNFTMDSGAEPQNSTLLRETGLALLPYSKSVSIRFVIYLRGHRT